ncbi:MAG: CapA family protein [Actinomycetaceae bacterium]|nr:CapA family protein [Actinomycetaceae bacterium]
MNSRKQYFLGAIILASTLPIAACGSSTSSPEPSESPQPTDIATTASPSPTPDPIEITIAASGDILPHQAVVESAMRNAEGSDKAYDFTPMFSQITGLLNEVDLALCHVETPISPDNTNLGVPGTLVFNSPREVADAIAASGYDGCDFASNHTWDRGLDGLAATEEVLRDAGVGYAGPSAHEDRVNEPELYTVGDATVAHLAYTYTFPNTWGPDTTVPAEAPWVENWLWPAIGAEGILEQAHKAKEEGADFVVVSMHWGEEYNVQPTEDQTSIAHTLLESDDVDLILGAHVHVVQPCEMINGKHVIYGMGNSLSNQSPQTHASLIPETQDGMVALFTLKKDPDGTVSTDMAYQPTHVDLDGHIITRVSPDSNPASYERTVNAVNYLGGCDAEVYTDEQ